MRERPLTDVPVSIDEFNEVRRLFLGVSMDALLKAREAYYSVLISNGLTKKSAGLGAGILRAACLAAAASQNVILGGFTQTNTINLVPVAPPSVYRMFTTSVENGVFLAVPGETAPAQKEGLVAIHGNPSQIFHATPLGQTMLDIFELEG